MMRDEQAEEQFLALRFNQDLYKVLECHYGSGKSVDRTSNVLGSNVIEGKGSSYVYLELNAMFYMLAISFHVASLAFWYHAIFSFVCVCVSMQKNVKVHLIKTVHHNHPPSAQLCPLQDVQKCGRELLIQSIQS